jgi:diguanylate cyclase (GGDEF)-like protein
MSVVKRVKENVHRKVLVVDDSPSCRIVLSRYLSRQNLQVLEAKSAEEALEIIKREQDIFLIITDQNMGGMKGSDMIGEIRVNYARTDLAIIGISASNDKRLNALFLKSGANDFFAKPFSYEELFCRVTQNIDSVVLNKILADSASLDSISGTSNASHLMRMGNFFHHNLLRDNIDYAIICLQLLGFEELTSEHGLEVGEELLKHAGSQLMNVTRQSDAVARVSHSEFCLLCIGVEPATEKTVLTRVIDSIEKTPLVYEGVTHHLKLATHLSYPVAADFSTDLKEARQALKRMQSR